MRRLQVRVPISEPFVCPECASPLRAPARISQKEARGWLLPINVWILVAGVAASGACGFFLGRNVPLVHVQNPRMAAASVPVKPPMFSQLLRDQPSGGNHPSIRSSPPEGLSTGLGAGALPLPLVVTERPFPSHAPAVERIDPPHRMQAEVQAGQVVIDCLLGSAVFHPACKVSNARGTDAFSEAAVAWLQKLPVRYVTGAHGAATVALDHRWRVVFDDFTTPPPEPRVPPKPISTPKRR